MREEPAAAADIGWFATLGGNERKGVATVTEIERKGTEEGRSSFCISLSVCVPHYEGGKER